MMLFSTVDASSVTAYAAPPVSLRLGHAAVLTSHCDVIHFRVAATLPTGEGERLQTQPNNITR